jgi:putative FmdB family regulatory protein
MPTYDYRCKNCGYEFEAFQAMSDEPLKVCPECQGQVKRLIGGGAGLIFKGQRVLHQRQQKDPIKPTSSKHSQGKDKACSSLNKALLRSQLYI